MKKFIYSFYWLAAFTLTTIVFSSAYADEANLSTAKEMQRPGDKILYFTIEENTLENVLLEIAIKADLSLILPFKKSEKSNNGIRGYYSVTNALKKVLENLPYFAEVTPEGTILITKIEFVEPEAIEESSPIDLPFEEELVVTGFKYSILTANQIKREATQLIEVVTEEDINKMPDNNVAESLQRLPGVQIERRNGRGSTIRVRGFDSNIILLNGHNFLSGMELFQSRDKSYEGSLESIPIDLLTQIEVMKTPRASQIEGSLGGTVNLKTRNGFDLDSPLIVAEIAAEQGHYSSQAKPQFNFVAGNNWNDQFASIFSLSYTQNVSSTDEILLFSSKISPSYPLIADIHFDQNASVDDYALFPSVADVTSQLQKRKSLGLALNLEFKPIENTLISFDWLGLDTDITEHQHTIGHSLSYNRYTETNSSGFSSISVNDTEPGSTLASLYSNEFSLPVDSYGERDDIQANNFTLNAEYTFSERINIQSNLQHLVANTKTQQANLESTGVPRNHPRWIANNPDFTDLMIPTGWLTYQGSANAGDGEILREINFINGERPSLAYTNEAWLTDPSFMVFERQNASATTNKNQVNAFSLDANILLTDEKNVQLNLGMRQSRSLVEFKQLHYLTDFSRTTDVNTPNSYDENGNVVVPADVDPNRPAIENNIGMQFPDLRDLCGNGGLQAGMGCDIDGDGINDNLWQSGWSYNHLPTDAPAVFSSSGIPIFNILYNIPPFPFSNSITPGYAPSISWADAPERIKHYDNFFPSGGYQHNVALPNLDIVTDDVEQWIDNLTPRTPGKWFYSPLGSWEVQESTTAAYMEMDYTSLNETFKMLGGVRVVRTETDIVNASPENPIFYRELVTNSSTGIPLNYENNKTKRSYTKILPAITAVWSIYDDYNLRAGYHKNIARPRLHDLAKPLLRTGEIERVDELSFTSVTSGNIDLQPYETSQYDLAIEKYWNKLNYFQLNFFRKDVDNFIRESNTIASATDENGEEVNVAIKKSINLDKNAVKGIELGLQQIWDNGLGFTLNYTYTDSDEQTETFTGTYSGLVGLSRNTFNFTGIYESDLFSVRLAHSYRSEFLSANEPFKQAATGRGYGQDIYLLANVNDPYKRWDARFTYKHLDQLFITVDIQNITEESSTGHLESRSANSYYRAEESRAMISLKYVM